MATPNTPKVIEDCHRCLLWLIPKLDNFPRTRRFTLGERLESALLEVLVSLTEASYGSNKLNLLKQANKQLAVARHLWRLAMELQCVSMKSYAYGSALFDAIGKQMGAWFRYLKQHRG